MNFAIARTGIFGFFFILSVVTGCSSGGGDSPNSQQPKPSLEIPTGISINENYQTLSIQWRAVLDATSYDVYLDTQQNILNPSLQSENYQEFRNITETQLDISGLQNDTVYYFILRADGDGGRFSAFTPVGQGTPKIVLAQQPQGFAASYVSSTSVSLSWTNDPQARNGYRILRAESGGTYADINAVIDASASSYTDTISPGIIYDYQLMAVNELGDSPAAQLHYVPPPLTPTAFSAVPVSETQATISWTQGDSITDSYELTRSDNGAAPVPVGGLISKANPSDTVISYLDSGLVGNHTYSYSVVAVNAGGKSQALQGSYAAPVKPTAPVLTSSIAVGPTVTIGWSNVDVATTNLVLSRSPAGQNSYTQIASFSAPNLGASFDDTGVAAGNSYDYQLQAFNGTIVSDASIISVSLPALATTPTNFAASYVSATSVALSWTAVASASSYNLFRAAAGGTYSPLTTIASGATTSYTDVSAQAGTKYDYQIEAANILGASTRATLSYVPPPATPINLKVTTNSDTLATVSWTQGDTITDSYTLTRSDNNAAPVAIGGVITKAQPTDTVISYQDTVVGGHSYTYSVVAVNTGGNSSAVTGSYSAPLKPATPLLTAALATGPLVNLSWSGVDTVTTSLVLSRSLAGANQYSPIDTSIAPNLNTSFSDTTAAAGSAYDYQLVAYNGSVVKSNAAQQSVSVPALPATPINFSTATQSLTAANISWSAGDNVSDSFELTRSDNGAAPVAIGGVISNTGAVVTYADSGLVAGHTYTYSILAVNVSGKSSVALSGTYLAPVTPATPVLATTLATGPVVQVSWSGVDPVTTQLVLSRSVSGANTYSTIYTGNAPNLGTSFNDSGVTVGNSYDYQLLAYNGPVITSAAATQTIAVSASAPASAPTGFSAAYNSATTVKLSWTGDGSAATYTLSRIVGGVSTQLSNTVAGTASSYIDTVDPLGLYQYEIVAVNVLGSSVPVPASYAPPVPATPTLFTASYNATTAAVDLSWSGDAALTVTYKLERIDTSVTPATTALLSDTLAGSATSFSDAGALPGKAYTYQLTAINNGGSSTPATVPFSSVPVAPSALAWQQLSNTSLRISWTPGAASTGFVVLREDTPGSGVKTPVGGTLPGTATSVDDTGVVESHAYRYEVYATNATGNSASAILDLTTLAKPALPTGFAAAIVNGPTVNLSWNALAATVDGLVLTQVPTATPTAAVDIASVQPPTLVPTAFSDSTVAAGLTYDYRLQVSAGVMLSDPVWVYGVSIPALPLAPTLSLGDVTSLGAKLSWLDNSNNEDNFLLERAEQNGPNNSYTAFATVKTLAANTLSTSDDAASTPPFLLGSHYKYRVSAKNVSGATPSNEVITVAPPVDSNGFLAFANKSAPRFQEDVAKAQAYYAAVDPSNKKLTLAQWKAENQFVEGSGLPKDTPAIYVNDADLGFARRMFVNPAVEVKDAAGNIINYKVASYVENYPSLSDALIADPVARASKMIATVAMEYTEPDYGTAGPPTHEVELAKHFFDNLDRNFGTTTYLNSGYYKFVVSPAATTDDPNHTYVFNVFDVVTDPLTGAVISETQVISEPAGSWTKLGFSTGGIGFNYAANEYPVNFTDGLRHRLRIELKADFEIDVDIVRQFKITDSATATIAGGSATTAALTLPEGDYTIVGATPTYWNGGSAGMTATITSNLAAPTSQTKGLYIGNGSDNNPLNPYLNNVTFSLTAAQAAATTTIDLSLTTAGSSTITPKLYLGTAMPTTRGLATDPVVWLSVLSRIISNSGNPYTYPTSMTNLSMPAGNYEMALNTYNFGLNYDFQFFDDITNSNVTCTNPVANPSSVTTGSIGPNPFNPSTPRCGFTVTPVAPATQSVVALRADDITATPVVSPLLSIMGDPGPYRNFIAHGTTQLPLAPRVIMKQTLAAGSYTLVPVTDRVGQISTYQVTVTDAAGTVLLSQAGGWNPSGGLNRFSANNPAVPLTLTSATAVTIELTLPVASGGNAGIVPALYLVDANDQVIAQDEGNRHETGTLDVDLLPGKYEVVLTTWDGGYRPRASVDVYIDGETLPSTSVKNLYVDEHQWENPNFPGAPRVNFTMTKPGHAHVVINSDYYIRTYLVGEGDRKFVTFYTYIGQVGYDDLVARNVIGAAGSPYPAGLVVGDRVLAANLDGKGDKFQPGVCNVCHGGAPKSPVNSVYPDYGDTNAGFLSWDMDLFKYDPTPGSAYSRANLFTQMKDFNRVVLAVQKVPTYNSPGVLSSQTARNQMIYGWYGGPTLPSTTFNGSFVPPGWTPDSISGVAAGIPDGADQLYLQVVKPTCRLCHVQRGTLTQRSYSETDAPITFKNYSDFFGYKDEIIDLVYDRATMPLAKRTFDHFWSRGQADLLASFLGATVDANGNAIQPGRPIASSPYPANIPAAILNSATADITIKMATTAATTPGSLTLNATNSVFADTYNWTVTPAVAGATYNLDTTNPAKPIFTAATDGDYTISLTASNSATGQTSVPSTVVVNASSTFVPVSFSKDIMWRFDNTLGDYVYPGGTPLHPLTRCILCHSTKQEYLPYDSPAVRTHPVFYDKSTYLWSMAGPASEVYANMLDRINLNDPLESRMLNAGSKLHHPDNPEGWGFDDWKNNWQHFNLMLQWINEGAPNN